MNRVALASVSYAVDQLHVIMREGRQMRGVLLPALACRLAKNSALAYDTLLTLSDEVEIQHKN